MASMRGAKLRRHKQYQQKGLWPMQKDKLFWDYFKATGNIGAYLLFCRCNKKPYSFPNGIMGSKRKRKLG